MYLPTEHKFESKSIGHRSYNQRKSRDMKMASFPRMTHIDCITKIFGITLTTLVFECNSTHRCRSPT